MNRSRLGILVVVIALIGGASLIDGAALSGGTWLLPISEGLNDLVAWGRRAPVAGPLLYVLFGVAATVLFVPGSVVIMIGGFLFGFGSGLVAAAIAIPLGAQCAFWVARWVARPWVKRKLAGITRLQAIEAALQERAFLIVTLTRLSLIIPFNLLNYVYGSTSVRASTHLAATAVGMLPAVCLFVYLGSLAGNLEQILAGSAAPSELTYWTLVAGIAAIAAATWVIHRTASRSLEKHLSIQKKAESN